MATKLAVNLAALLTSYARYEQILHVVLQPGLVPTGSEGVQMSDVASHSEVEIGSERSFGFVFAAVFAIIAFWPVIFSDGSVRIWAIVCALAFAVVAVFAPRFLAPLNKIWFKFGMLLGSIVAPIVMGLIFVLTVIPIGYLRRLKNPDPLNQRFDPDAETYWVTRSKDQAPTSMTKQF